MPLPGTDSLVPGALKPLPDMGCGRNLVNRATPMDRVERDEISRVEGTNSAVKTCHRLQPEA